MATERQTAKIRALKPTGSRIWIYAYPAESGSVIFF